MQRFSVDSSMTAVAVATLSPGQPLGFPLYIRHKASEPMVLYRDRGLAVDREDVDRLVENDIRTLYIRSSDNEDYCTYLRETVVRDASRAPAERYQALRQAGREVFLDAFRSRQPARLVAASQLVAQDIVEVTFDTGATLEDLFNVMVHNYSTYAHATNVATYAVMLATRLGTSDPAELACICQGGLLHDLGKRHIPRSILDKKARLTPDERRHMEQHPSLGFKELCHRPEINWGQLMMVYQHHERLDGTGYPVGVDRRDIHEWARICAVADVYDALTRDRAYRKGSMGGDALDFLIERADTHFEREIVQCWIETIEATAAS